MDPVDDRFPWATALLLAGMGLMAYLVTGFIPTEQTLSQVWWSTETMEQGQWGRLFTSILAHGGPLHLAFNAIALLSMVSLERELGSLRYATILVLSGLGGQLGHVLTSDIPAVGASGAIFGLLGVILVLTPSMRLMVLGIPMPAIVALTGYLSVVLLIPGFSDLAPIAHFAHIGGMLVGMAAGLVLAPRRGLVNLTYVGLVFGATLVLVGFLRTIQLDALVRTYELDGVLGVVQATWPAWVALAAIGLALWGLEEDADAGSGLEPADPV